MSFRRIISQFSLSWMSLSYKNSREARKELEKRGVVLTKKYNRNEVKRMKEDEVNERN